MRMGPGKHLRGLTLMGGIVTPEEFNYFHEVGIHIWAKFDSIADFHFSSSSHRSFLAAALAVMEMVIPDASPCMCILTFLHPGLLGGKVIGLPPVLNFGSETLKAKVVPEVLSGKKFICLAISEAQAGSDVMGLQTSAVKSEDGKEWIINGT